MSRAPDLHRAADAAARVLLAQRVDALPVDPLRLLRACRDTQVYTFEDAADTLDVPRAAIAAHLRDADAVTYRMPSAEKLLYIIVYRTDGNPARLRFTLAHELGHRVLGHEGTSPAEEAEADCFASHLLCPEPVVKAVAAHTADVVWRLAQACYVTDACARCALARPSARLSSNTVDALQQILAVALVKIAPPKAE